MNRALFRLPYSFSLLSVHGVMQHPETKEYMIVIDNEYWAKNVVKLSQTQEQLLMDFIQAYNI